MKRDNFTMPLAFPDELIIDNFAGGGGTSTGLEAAFGRPVDIAINHDPEALAMHAINHPHTLHLCESVWDVDPVAVTGNQPVALVWLSPDCKHFSKAKGGTPVAKHIRGLAWVGMRWVAKCKPRVLMLENVEEFKTWGPLLVSADGAVRPDPVRKGKTFDSFVRQLRAHGYAVDWRVLRACDNGAPTIRKRLFLTARRDGLPIVWPEQTHGAPTDRRVLAGKLLPHRTAAECIDFTLPAASIFDRKKPLATNTQRRVAKGLWRYVLANENPFIVGNTAATMTMLRGTTEVHLGGCDVQAPLSTVAASGMHHALVGAHLVTAHVQRNMGCSVGHAITDPLATTTAGGGGKSAMVAAFLEQANGGFYDGDGRPVNVPASTITSSGAQQRLVTAYAVKYYSSGGQWQGLGEPMHTLPTKGRVGLVQSVLVSADSLAPEHRARARQCAELLHQHLPEHFPTAADVVLMWTAGIWSETLRRKSRSPKVASQPGDYSLHLFDGAGHVDAGKLLLIHIIVSPPPPESRKRMEARDGTAPFIASRESSTQQGTALLKSGFKRPSG